MVPLEFSVEGFQSFTTWHHEELVERWNLVGAIEAVVELGQKPPGNGL